jgi:predicted aspartyl protease
MKIEIVEGLPFVTVTLVHRNQALVLERTLLDTGSAGTLFSADAVLNMGLRAEATDTLHRIRGVGGAEFVFTKQIDQLALGELMVKEFEIEIGAMDYGFGLAGIIGMDFLTRVGAVINLTTLEIYQA